MFVVSLLLPQLGELEPLMLRFTVDEEKQMQRILQRLDILAKVISNPLQADYWMHVLLIYNGQTLQA